MMLHCLLTADLNAGIVTCLQDRWGRSMHHTLVHGFVRDLRTSQQTDWCLDGWSKDIRTCILDPIDRNVLDPTECSYFLSCALHRHDVVETVIDDAIEPQLS